MASTIANMTILSWRGVEHEFTKIDEATANNCTAEKWSNDELKITLIASVVNGEPGVKWIGEVDAADDDLATWMINASVEYASTPNTALDILQGRIDSVRSVFSIPLP